MLIGIINKCKPLDLAGLRPKVEERREQQQTREEEKDQKTNEGSLHTASFIPAGFEVKHQHGWNH